MSWEEFFKEESSKAYYQELEEKLAREREEYEVFPSKEDVFNAFKLCKFDDLKVILFGQDPYHGVGEATGLAFSVNSTKFPPSLRNIFKELQNEFGLAIPRTGNLNPWAKQGMLLINRTLTVRKDTPLSHQKIGWEEFIKNLIYYLNKQDKKYCYVLLGNDAKSLEKYISQKDYIIKGVHPSPLSASRGFFNSGIFKEIDEFCLKEYHEHFDFSLEQNLFD